MTTKNKTPAAAEALESLENGFEPKHSRENAAYKMFGAILLQPALARHIPLAVQSSFSAYGRFTVRACAEGWGIEGIAHALTGFGLDGGDIVNAAIAAVPGDPERAFWQAIRQLCEGVAA